MSLNKSASDGVPASSCWSGTPDWYLWDGRFVALGRSEEYWSAHEHHAIQIVVAVEGTVSIRCIASPVEPRGARW
jgi:hypothetical protein